MFLSTYENKLDKKGRVSVPASFRSYLSNLDIMELFVIHHLIINQ